MISQNPIPVTSAVKDLEVRAEALGQSRVTSEAAASDGRQGARRRATVPRTLAIDIREWNYGTYEGRPLPTSTSPGG